MPNATEMELLLAEHDDTGSVGKKKVLNYIWDTDAAGPVKVTGTSDGEQTTRSQIWGWNGSNYHRIRIDEVSRALEIISDSHHHVHNGEHYVVSDVAAISTTTVKWMITTPNSAVVPHMTFNVSCTGEMLVVITEGADRTGGTALTEINRDRNSSNTSTTIATRTPSAGSTDGATTIFSIRDGNTGSGAKTIEGGGERGENEFLLKKNTKYIVAVTTYAAENVTFEIDWYEHTGLEPSASPSISPSVSTSISTSISPSVSPSISPSVSVSISPSISPSVSTSISPSISPSTSISPSVSVSISPSISSSISVSISPSVSPS